MNRFAAVLTICILVSTVVYAQLTPSQEELSRKYKNQKVFSSDDEAERFVSPDIYNDEPDVFIVNEADNNKSGNQGNQIKLYGHDIFDSELFFTPGLHDLPPEGYTLGPGDNVIVNVWGRVELELNLTVDREGKVFIPKVGELVVSGSTLEQFKQVLNKKFKKVYSDYEFSVTYGKLRQIQIYVFGEVNKPSGYTVSSLANLLHALYTAGGITGNGSLRNIRLIRNTKVINSFDFYDLLLKGDNSKDMKLMSGDVVYVPVAGPLVSIIGEVKRPAIYELTGNETVTELIALAGGTSPAAFLESVSLDRIGPGDNRILIDLDLTDQENLSQNNIRLEDGDNLTIYSKYDFHENRVYLGGYVKHAGSFGISDTTRISHLITGRDQLKENAYTERADLFRTNVDGTKTLIPIKLESILNGNKEDDLKLMPYDSLVVYSYYHISREKYVKVSGAVKNPGQYNLYNDMKLSDLIFLTGNLSRQAYLVQCEIARVNQGHTTEILQVNLEDILINNNSQADILLKEDDHIFVRQIPEWRPVQTVTLEGEVKFPGTYAIHHEDERLSSLIKRAGGLTPTAFPDGAIFYREAIEAEVGRRNIGQIINNTREVYTDSLGKFVFDNNVNYDPSELNRIIIDLPELLKKPEGQSDIILANSDYIHIPTYPSGIQVIGAIAANGTISFKKGKKASYYIEQAGGLTPDGDISSLRLVKPNSKVYYGGKARSRKIELGDAIVVPSKIKRKTDWGKVFATTATIVSSMATTILIVDRLK